MYLLLYILESKSHAGWIKEGDMNTNIFPAFLVIRRASHALILCLPCGLITNERVTIGPLVVDFFQDILGELFVVPNGEYFSNI